MGCFLPDPVAVPTPIVDFLAEQLGIVDASCIKQYAARPATQWEHAAEIRAAFGYRTFSDSEASADLRAYLAACAWTRLEPSKALFDAVVRWLRRRRVATARCARAGQAGDRGARDGLTAKAPVLARRTVARRTATLVATVRSLTSTAVDDALDLFGVLMATRLIRQAERVTRDQKLAAFARVTRSATTLAAVVRAMMDADDDDDDGLWRAELVKRFDMVCGSWTCWPRRHR